VSAARRFVVVSDSHGEHENGAVSDVLHQFIGNFKPEIRVHLGDAFDFAWLRTKASVEEQRDDIHDDLVMGCAFMRRYKPTHVVWGNHDYRLFRHMTSSNGPMAHLCGVIHDRVMDALPPGCVQVPYGKRGVLDLGPLRMVHGVNHGVGALRQTLNFYGGAGRTVVMGHVHRVETVSHAHVDGGEGHVCPSICHVDLEYNIGSPATLAQRNGWMYGTVGDKECSIWHVSIKPSGAASTPEKTYRPLPKSSTSSATIQPSKPRPRAGTPSAKSRR
jgi:predicted phosphodiesterase